MANPAIAAMGNIILFVLILGLTVVLIVRDTSQLPVVQQLIDR